MNVIFKYSTFLAIVVIFILYQTSGREFYTPPVVDEGKENLVSHTCKTTWAACSSASELMNENDEIRDEEVKCENASKDIGPHGSPVWKEGWMYSAFHEYYPDYNFKQNHKFALVDSKALLPNAFGGYDRVKLICMLNLDNGNVSVDYFDSPE